MNAAVLQSGPVTLYAQLANILRDRIVSGAWKPGEEVPTLDELAQEFSVARVTVRQAVQRLAEEGMLSSQRGRRTYVTFEPPPVSDSSPLYSSIGEAGSEGGSLSIKIISKTEVAGLPAYFAGPGIADARYMRVRKIERQSGIPYAVSDNFIALKIFQRIPANAERTIKLSRLVRDHARPRLVRGTERITVSTLNLEEATHLQAPLGSPAARVTRVFLGPKNLVAYFSQVAYRSERFAIERDISDMLVIPGKT
jgi:GntR family transcriptional regulator